MAAKVVVSNLIINYNSASDKPISQTYKLDEKNRLKKLINQ